MLNACREGGLYDEGCSLEFLPIGSEVSGGRTWGSGCYTAFSNNQKMASILHKLDGKV